MKSSTWSKRLPSRRKVVNGKRETFAFKNLREQPAEVAKSVNQVEESEVVEEAPKKKLPAGAMALPGMGRGMALPGMGPGFNPALAKAGLKKAPERVTMNSLP